MPKKTRLTPFSLNYFFFFFPLLLVTPETLPNHLFRQTNDQKWSRKLPKRTKKIFLFYNLFHIFPLLSRKKTKPLFYNLFHIFPLLAKPLTFSALCVTGNWKTSRENVPWKIFLFPFFFFFFFTFLHPTASRNRKNYHLPFFRNSDLKCPKMPLSALKFHILQITFFPRDSADTYTFPNTLRFS